MVRDLNLQAARQDERRIEVIAKLKHNRHPRHLPRKKVREKKTHLVRTGHCCRRAAAMAHVVNHIGWGGWCCRASGASAFLFYLLLMPVYVRTMCPLS